MAGKLKGKINVAVLVAGPAQDEHDGQLHQAMLIEKGLTNLANVTIIGEKFSFISINLPPFTKPFPLLKT